MPSQVERNLVYESRKFAVDSLGQNLTANHSGCSNPRISARYRWLTGIYGIQMVQLLK